ncbi:MAG: hypothetical protein V3S22_05640 [Candidatus Neomarinimicrobiota bacterium]
MKYISTWGPPLLTIFLGITAGWIFKRFIYHRLKKITEKNNWKFDDLII